MKLHRLGITAGVDAVVNAAREQSAESPDQPSPVKPGLPANFHHSARARFEKNSEQKNSHLQTDGVRLKSPPARPKSRPPRDLGIPEEKLSAELFAFCEEFKACDPDFAEAWNLATDHGSRPVRLAFGKYLPGVLPEEFTLGEESHGAVWDAESRTILIDNQRWLGMDIMKVLFAFEILNAAMDNATLAHRADATNGEFEKRAKDLSVNGKGPTGEALYIMTAEFNEWMNTRFLNRMLVNAQNKKLNISENFQDYKDTPFEEYFAQMLNAGHASGLGEEYQSLRPRRHETPG